MCEVTAHKQDVVKSGSTTKRSLDFESRLESKAKFLETDRRRDLRLFYAHDFFSARSLLRYSVPMFIKWKYTDAGLM